MDAGNEDLLKLFAPPQVVSTGADELSSTPSAPTPTPPPPTTTPTPTPPQKDVATLPQTTPPDTSTEAKPPPKELPKAPNTKVQSHVYNYNYIHTAQLHTGR